MTKSGPNDAVAKLLGIYEANRYAFSKALTKAGGSGDEIVRLPEFQYVIHTLTRNHITVETTHHEELP